MAKVTTPTGRDPDRSSWGAHAEVSSGVVEIVAARAEAQPIDPPLVLARRPRAAGGKPAFGPPRRLTRGLSRDPAPRLAAEPERSASFVERLRRITDARTIGEVWAVQLELMAGYGFDRLLYASTRFRTERSIGDLQDVLFLTNHARDYASTMIERGLIRHAPMLVRAEAGSRSWSEPASSPAEGQPARLAALATEARRRLGLAAGYDVVFPEVSTRARGALELCARPGLTQQDVDALWDARGGEIELLCGLVHLKLCHLPSWGGRRPLTRQQRRVLQWASEGKTAQDIGAIMELTPATVEKHLRLAREALDVQTTAQAVAKAAHWNQLFVDERPALAAQAILGPRGAQGQHSPTLRP